MANIKFSQFTQKTTLGTVDFLVGYTGADNVQIDPADLLSDYSQGTGAAGQVTFFSATSTVTGDNNLYWDNTNKRLGVGTTSPSTKLQVNGTITADTHFTSSDSNVTLSTSGTGGVVRLRPNGISSTTGQVVVLDSGNVGIGTVSPSAKLEVNGTLIATGISQLGSGGNNVYLTSSSAGNVGIGTSSPSYKLDVRKNQAGYTYIASDNANTAASGTGSGFAMTEGGSVAWYLRNERDGSGKFNIGNSANRLTIDSSGNVGIGTNSPQAALHVSGPFNTNAPTGNGVLMGLYNNTHGYIHLNGSSGGYIDFSTSGVDHKGRILYDNTSNYLRFDTNGTEKVRITSAGNVGIGTTNPSHLLTLETASSPGLKIKDTTQGATLLAFSQDSNSHIGTFSAHPLVLDTNSAERMRVDSSGNVGIGTTSPSRTLHIGGPGGSSGGIMISPTSGDAEIQFQDSGTTNAYITLDDGTQDLNFRDDSATVMTIDFGGERVGIGTTSPTQALDVDGAIITEDYRSAGTFFLTSGDDWRFRSDTGSERMRITSSGDVGIGTASPAKELDVEGEALFGNGTNGLLFSYSNANSSGIIDTGHSSTALEFRVGNTQELLINGSSATFAGTVLIDGVSNYTGLEVKGVGGSRPEIKWSNANNGNLGNIYGTETNSLVIATGSSGTTALTLDSSQNATFAGDVEIADSSKGIILESPDGTRYRVTVANGGTLSVSAV